MRSFADLSVLLYDLFDKEVSRHFTNTEEFTIHSLCTALFSHPIFALPDFTKPLLTESYALDTTVGNVIIYKHESIHKPIAFLSKSLTSIEKNSIIHSCDLFAIILCCRAGHPYIYG